MTALAEPMAAVTEGHYVATSLSQNLQVAYDSFAIRELADGPIVIESKHTLFNSPLPPQMARFEVDRDWIPRRLKVEVGEIFSLNVEFGETAAVMTAVENHNEQVSSCPAGRHEAFFLLSGGLYFPLHVVRRFNFDNDNCQTFRIVPEGICEARRVADSIVDGRSYKQLELRVTISGIEDIARLRVNEQGDMVRYQTRNQNLLVLLEGAN